ncbi:MAG: hypothetical protein WC901_02875 [Candidatus Margulisiibacteriota bacterium]
MAGIQRVKIEGALSFYLRQQGSGKRVATAVIRRGDRSVIDQVDLCPEGIARLLITGVDRSWDLLDMSTCFEQAQIPGALGVRVLGQFVKMHFPGSSGEDRRSPFDLPTHWTCLSKGGTFEVSGHFIKAGADSLIEAVEVFDPFLLEITLYKPVVAAGGADGDGRFVKGTFRDRIEP